MENKNVVVPSKSGIYIIINKVNNKVYIGQSINLRQRFSQHLNKLRRDKHYNIHLQSSYNKYGEESFEYKQLIFCSKELLNDCESAYIKYYNSYDKRKGYNLTEDCNTHILETRKKISNKNKDLLIKNNIRKSENARKVNQYSLDGKFIKTWKSSKEINKELKIEIGNLNNYLNNFTTTKSLKSYMWKWFDNNISDIKPYKKGFKGLKKVEFRFGDIVKVYNSIKEACEDLKINKSTIYRSVTNRAKNKNNYIFKYL